MPKNKTKQKKVKVIKWGKDPVSQLYKATLRYIESKGGSAVMVTGIAIVQESSLKSKYGVMIRILGRQPIIPSKTLK